MTPAADFLRLVYPERILPEQYAEMLERVATFTDWRNKVADPTNAWRAAGGVCHVEGCSTPITAHNKSGLCTKHNRGRKGPVARMPIDERKQGASASVGPQGCPGPSNGTKGLKRKPDSADGNPWLDDAYRPEVQGPDREKARARVAAVIAGDAKNGGGE